MPHTICIVYYRYAIYNIYTYYIYMHVYCILLPSENNPSPILFLILSINGFPEASEMVSDPACALLVMTVCIKLPGTYKLS